MCGFVAACAHAGAADTVATRAAVSAAGGTTGEPQRETDSGGLLCSPLQKQLERSITLIKHRGPDDSNVWVNADATVGLGHCRLAINDTSPSGSQPLHSADDQIHAVVIGEIYEYEKLRRYCEGLGHAFRGRSDSELVLALYRIHGAPGLFQHLRGEFAFVIVDERDHARKVIAARDRFGIKPLFWTVHQDRVLFAAEAKAFLGFGWTPAWDVESIATSRWLADDRTVFTGVRKLAPGHWMEIGPAAALSELRTRPYWDAQYSTNTAKDHGGAHDEASIAGMIQEVRDKLVDAVRVRLRADVPMGLYLSGGIDSSAVAGIVAYLVAEEKMQFGHGRPDEAGHPPRIDCFTVGYTDATYDESSKSLLHTLHKCSCANLRPSCYHRGGDADRELAPRTIRAPGRVSHARDGRAEARR